MLISKILRKKEISRRSGTHIINVGTGKGMTIIDLTMLIKEVVGFKGEIL